jgi:hypothetical protein
MFFRDSHNGRAHRLRIAVVATLALFGACAPRPGPLAGAPAPSRAIPRLDLPGRHRRIVFRWDYSENALMMRGEGAIRTAFPDSARVDLFLTGGIPAGYAILVGDTIRATSQDQVRRFLPPPALMWAALGRLALPPLSDTTVTIQGDTLNAEIGRPTVWRIRLVGSRLSQLVRVSGGRIAESVTRVPGGRLLYEVPGRRRLWLGIVRDEEVPAFDASIWNR